MDQPAEDASTKMREARTGAGIEAFAASRTRFYSGLFGTRYLRENGLLLGANVLAGLCAYLLHPLLGHIMGVRAYGQVAALIALSLVLLTPTQLVATVAAKYASSMAVARKWAQLNDFIRHFTVILLPVGIGVAALFVIASSYVAGVFHLGSREAVIFLSLLFAVSFATPLNLGALLGLQDFGWYAAITILSPFLRLALPVAAVLMGLGVNGAMLGTAVGALLAYFVSFRPLGDILRGPREPMASTRSVWAFALLAGGAAAGVVALLSIDIVLARHYLDAREAGLYAALATIGRTVLFITSGVTLVMFPKVVALHERKEHHAHLAVQALISVLALAGAFAAVFYIAPGIVARLLFGHAFGAVASTLPLYGIAMLLLAAANVFVTYFLAVGKRAVVPAVWLGCVVEVGLIVWRHSTIAEIAQAVFTADAALLLALLLIALSTFLEGTTTADGPSR
jgi:O-antigen/teichoic acid export membrane protein